MKRRMSVVLLTVLTVTSATLVSCGAGQKGSESILLFDGAGVARESFSALRALLDANHLDYATVGSVELNRMDQAALRRHKLLIIPGGNFVEIGGGLSKDAARRVRDAVRHGLNYLGVCAGAFLAGDSPYNGINLTSGVRFRFYAIEEKGIRKAPVWIASADGRRLEQYWEDGPQLTGWGEAIAKYPDGTPALVQGKVGEGWMVLTGVHPEAPEKWRRGFSFVTPASVDNEYAAKLIHAALEGRSLPHF